MALTDDDDLSLELRGLVRAKHFHGTARGCPGCGAPLDTDTSVDVQYGDSLEAMLQKPVAGPKPGDCGICLECGVLMVFVENNERRIATPEELAEFMADPQVVEMLSSIQRRKRSRRT